MLVKRSYLLGVIDGFLAHCGDFYDAVNGIYVGFFVTYQVQDLIILGIILLCLPPYVLWKADRCRATKVARYANISIMAVVAALFVPFVVIMSIVVSGNFTPESLITPSLDLAAAYSFLMLCAAVCDAVVLLFSEERDSLFPVIQLL
jgi:hypothetical protein